MIATALDPNQILIVAGSVLVAAITVQGGVTIRQGRRLKGVDQKTEQLVYNGGDSLRDDVSSTARQLSRLAADSAERWNVTVQMQDTVSRIHTNQVAAMAAAQDILKDIARMQQSLMHHDNRLTLLESHSSDKFARMETAIDALQRRLDQLTAPVPLHLTPPMGIPKVPAKVDAVPTDITD